jgi:hypothetical protein
MATFETIMFMGGPLDGEVKQGSFKDRIYFNAALQETESPLMQPDLAPNVRQLLHRYKRSLPTYEFEYEGYD